MTTFESVTKASWAYQLVISVHVYFYLQFSILSGPPYLASFYLLLQHLHHLMGDL